MILHLLALASLTAPPAPAELAGVWQGTVGNLPVRACFDQREWGSFGTYYYFSQRRLIPLEADQDGARAFAEVDSRDRNNPRWRIDGVDGDGLTGEWTQGSRSLAVRLQRLPAGGGDQRPCGSLAFHAPRLEGARTVAERRSLDGRSYTRLSLDHGGRFAAGFETFALEGDGDAVQRINAILGEPLAGDPPEWFECVRTPLGQSPYEGSFDDRLAPTLISARWMNVAHEYDNYCGGTHPNHRRRYRVFDLASGEEIDLHDWFNDIAVKRHRWNPDEEEIKTLQPGFRDFILAGWSVEDPECADAVRDYEYWNIGLQRGSLILSPDLPHVAQACGEEFTMTFASLRPFLTEEGAANLRMLEAVAGSRP